MGGACHSVLGEGETFLTADLHAEFFRPTRPGTLRAEGRVVQRTKRTVFCSADLRDAEGTHLASARCTQVLRSEPHQGTEIKLSSDASSDLLSANRRNVSDGRQEDRDRRERATEGADEQRRAKPDP